MSQKNECLQCFSLRNTNYDKKSYKTFYMVANSSWQCNTTCNVMQNLLTNLSKRLLIFIDINFFHFLNILKLVSLVFIAHLSLLMYFLLTNLILKMTVT